MDETSYVQQAFSGLLVGVAWGVAVAVFVEPLGIGVVRDAERERMPTLRVRSAIDTITCMVSSPRLLVHRSLLP